ncbi:receptor-like protein 6 isoform X1 [Gossypium arboreum]|uniref:receptor-like protein 6 isoform X1 n=1 Tax=Gossypium arboreum TaxID=29729 RepID=UPI0022F1C8A0|nr:receptor-like protein 6 isoform X1 [Gossypium arboreum]
MGKFIWLCPIRSLLFVLFFLSVVDSFLSLSSSSLNPTPLCLPEDTSALLQFNNTLFIDESAHDLCAYPKTKSWNESTNCCTWEGVTCNKVTGQVISLDLSCSMLTGSLSPNTSLFRLQGLKRLDLSFNNFSGSIPSGFSQLVSLTYLNFSGCSFSGSVPLDISLLSKLISLDLSTYDLKFDRQSFDMLTRNFSKLENLVLDRVNMSDVVPTSFMNLPSSLKQLGIKFCNLKGKFPTEIFQFRFLEYVDLSLNSLTGYLPSSNWSSHLKYIDLNDNQFRGSIPASIGNLTKITFLDLSNNEFQGQLPSALFSLKQLTDLVLSNNSLEGLLPTHVRGFQDLKVLCLSNNLLTGAIPSWPFTLPSLEELDLSGNSLSGPINQIQKPKSVQKVDLGYNEIHGEIPSSFFDLVNLTELDLSSNNFNGVINSVMFSKLENLLTLDLSSNSFSGVIKLDVLSKLKRLMKLNLSNNTLLSWSTGSGSNTTFQELDTLYFSSCNVRQFPNFLRSAKKLSLLDLSNNSIQGSIFKWESEGWEQLIVLNLSYNSLTGLEHFPGKNLKFLDLRSNQLHNLPLTPLPPSLQGFWISNNNLTGKIPPSICNLTSLDVLDMSRNYLGGVIPACLGNFSHEILNINLQMNKFRGKIPDFCVDDNALMNLALNDNQLEGLLPRSLSNCTSLKFLNLANNKLSDTFPHWLGVLPDLQVLILRFNNFQGPLSISSDTKPSFSSLQIADLSQNKFTGLLPTTFFQNLDALKHAISKHKSMFQEAWENLGLYQHLALDYYGQISENVTTKRSDIELEYKRSLPIFSGIDFSSNKFYGKIPDVIGQLHAIHMLNLSDNNFIGHIPPSLGNLMELESLDLSSNKLSGRIPSQLTNLTFLAVLNFSNNNLVGPIPQGNQFDTFENDSYHGNLGLCGFPLTKQCDEPKPPPSKFKEDEGSPISFLWKLVMMGYGCGAVLGLSTGYIVFTTGRPWWFVRMVERDWKPNFTRWVCKIRGKRNIH